VRRYSSYSYLNLGTRWGWVVIAPAVLYPQGITPCIHWTGGWVGHRASLDAEARRKFLCPGRGSNPVRPALSQTLYCLSYRGSRTRKANIYEHCLNRLLPGAVYCCSGEIGREKCGSLQVYYENRSFRRVTVVAPSWLALAWAGWRFCSCHNARHCILQAWSFTTPRLMLFPAVFVSDYNDQTAVRDASQCCLILLAPDDVDFEVTLNCFSLKFVEFMTGLRVFRENHTYVFRENHTYVFRENQTYVIMRC
jgi:hypothetical protein